MAGLYTSGAWQRPYAPGPNQSECAPLGAPGLRRCVRVQWGFAQTAYDRAKEALTPVAWHGSLLAHQRDGSGLEAKRARLYDPATGRFTQEDPIGLAGGLNAYGYADGDPVTFSDPFGLCPPQDTNWGPHCAGWWTTTLELTGAVLGGAIGGFSGGAGGAAACAVTVAGAIPCAIGGGALGATAGAKRGAIVGATAGALIEGGLAMARAGKGRGGNSNPNADADRIVREEGLNKAGRRALHDQISRRDLPLEEIRDIARKLAEQAKYRLSP